MICDFELILLVKKSDFPRYDDYPFETKGMFVAYKRSKTHVAKKQVVHETGEVITMSELEDEKEFIMDSEPYIKMFKSGYLLLPNIGKRGSAVLSYVLSQMTPGRNFVEMHYEDVISRYPSLKGDGFYVGVSELMTFGALAMRSGRGHRYWVNMNMFFNGDRRRAKKRK